jgi:uncharacterized protein (TIGR02452 family)
MTNRQQRAAIAQETVAIIERGSYCNARGETVHIGAAQAAAMAGTVHYDAAQLQRLAAAQAPLGTGRPTCITVNRQSTLAGARELLAQGCDDVLCLNFASARNPGGGFLGGSEAQEESLAKSSGLYPCLTQNMAMYGANRNMAFCAYLDDMIYSPRVPVFRDDNYGLLEQPYLVSMVSAPAVNRSAVAQQQPERLGELDAIMLGRIGLLLALARARGHRHLVLGAWGCGVFGNRAEDMARSFHAQLVDNPRYRGAFDTVLFAVLDKRGDSYDAFARQFAGS